MLVAHLIYQIKVVSDVDLLNYHEVARLHFNDTKAEQPKGPETQVNTPFFSRLGQMFMQDEAKWIHTFVSGVVLALLTFRLGLGTCCLKPGKCNIMRAVYNLLLFIVVVILNLAVIFVSCLTVPESDPFLFVRVCIGTYVSMVVAYLIFWPILLFYCSQRLLCRNSNPGPMPPKFCCFTLRETGLIL